jgi:hypothetical protein
MPFRRSCLRLTHSHSIYVVSADSKLDNSRHEIFRKIIQHISDGYAVAYVGEENENAIIQHFLDRGITIEHYIEKGLLTIINRDVFYSPFVPAKILLEQWNKLFANIEKKAGRGSFKGFVAMGMPADSFFISELDNQQLVRYESLAAKQYNGSLEAMCIYTAEMLQRMPLRHVISLLNAHQNTGHRNGRLREWNIKRGLSIIKRGLDSALGPNVSELVLPTIIRDFEMNEEGMVLHPDQFERKLAILLGTSAADLVIHQINAEITKDIVY